MPTITPFLWFDANAADAAAFYTATFPNSRITSQLIPAPGAKPLTIALDLNGQSVTFLNGGPGHPLTEAFSFVVTCQDQAEIDQYWSTLLEGGSEIQCGWLKDRFGLCWQIVPVNLGELLSHPKAMQAMMQMKKLDIAALKSAAE